MSLHWRDRVKAWDCIWPGRGTAYGLYQYVYGIRTTCASARWVPNVAHMCAGPPLRGGGAAWGAPPPLGRPSCQQHGVRPGACHAPGTLPATIWGSVCVSASAPDLWMGGGTLPPLRRSRHRYGMPPSGRSTCWWPSRCTRGAYPPVSAEPCMG
jgi:hypothetical protein